MSLRTRVFHSRIFRSQRSYKDVKDFILIGPAMTAYIIYT